MEQEQKKTPVDIVQKLIALHTTRKEVCEKMVINTASKDIQDKLNAAMSQSDRFTKALLNELSEFGDAVQSEVNRDDEYHELWNKETANTDTMDASSSSDTFKQLENCLINIYTQTLDKYPDLPVTLNDLLISQVNELKQTV